MSENYTTITHENSDLSVYQLGSVVCAGLMLIATFIGVFGNFMTFYIFSRRNMRSSINVLLAGLAVIDCGLLIFGSTIFVPFAIMGPARQCFNITVFDDLLTPYLTVYFAPVPMILQTASVWTLIFITIERFMAVCYPFVAKRFCTVNKAIQALVILTFLSVLYNLCRFWEYSFEWNNQTDTPAYRQNLRESISYMEIYNLYGYFLFMLLIPFLLLCILNLRIVVGVQRAKRARKRMSGQEKKEQSTTVMMLVIIVVFLLCNSLAFALSVLEVVSLKIPEEIFFFAIDVSNLLVETNSCVNFMIYFKFSEKYRSEFRKIMWRCGHRGPFQDRLDRAGSFFRMSTTTQTIRLPKDSSPNAQRDISTSSGRPLMKSAQTPSEAEETKTLLNSQTVQVKIERHCPIYSETIQEMSHSHCNENGYTSESSADRKYTSTSASN